jgi:hypothetical protein
MAKRKGLYNYFDGGIPTREHDDDYNPTREYDEGEWREPYANRYGNPHGYDRDANRLRQRPDEGAVSYEFDPRERHGLSQPQYGRFGLSDVEWERYKGGKGSGRYDRDWTMPGPMTGRGPKGYQRSNERIREELNYRLTEHGQIDATGIEVAVDNGIVTLAGEVDSRQSKKLAENVADSVPGVRDVNNQLRIRRDE